MARAPSAHLYLLLLTLAAPAFAISVVVTVCAMSVLTALARPCPLNGASTRPAHWTWLGRSAGSGPTTQLLWTICGT
jgi:hypothetical protein